MVSLLNGFSQMGKSIATFAGSAAIEQQKADLEKEQTILANTLREGSETRLAAVQGDQARQTTQVAATAQGDQQRQTDQYKTTLPMTAAEKATTGIQQGTLNETIRKNQEEEKRPIPGGFSGSFMIKDPTDPSGWKQVTTSAFSPEASALMAALAEKGISLPAGLRSQAQQKALYQGLLDRNVGKTPDQIADGIKSGQIQFGAEKKETQTAAGIAGRVGVAENEIKQFAPLVRQASAKVKRGDFVPITQLLQMKDTAISKPGLRTLKIQINGLLNAYDVLAARGGTDADKRAEAHSLLTKADSPEVLEEAVAAFEVEAAAASRAARDAMKLHPEESEDNTPPLVVIPSWVKAGDQYNASKGVARDKSGKEYGPTP